MQYLEYLPEVFADIREIRALAVAFDPEIKALEKALQNLYLDQHLYTMTENGIIRWEKILHITPMGTDTLDDRRFRIINRINTQFPYTYRMMEAHLKQMCGEDNYRMSYTKETWTLMIKIGLSAKKQYDEILDMIDKMIPANLILDFDLLYNTYGVLSQFTHGQLARYTHKQLREEVLKVE